jgi:hypothetical protein
MAFCGLNDYKGRDGKAKIKPKAPPQPAAAALAALKALEGDWVDAEGAFGPKGAVAARYQVTGAGTTVIESFPVGTPHEMITVYHVDGDDLVLTHYCTAGNQPRMRARTFDGKVLQFAFDGGSNLDPATDSHMHAVTLRFVGPDEIVSEWTNWSAGRSDHAASFRLTRKR